MSEVEIITEELVTRCRPHHKHGRKHGYPAPMMLTRAAPGEPIDQDVTLKWVCDSDGLVYMSMPADSTVSDKEAQSLVKKGISIVNFIQKIAIIEGVSFLDPIKFNDIINKFPLLAKMSTDKYIYDSSSTSLTISKDFINNIMGLVSAPTRIANATNKVFRAAQNDFKYSSDKMSSNAEVAKLIVMVEFLFGFYILKVKFVKTKQESKTFATKVNCGSYSHMEEKLQLETDIYVFDDGSEYDNINDLVNKFNDSFAQLKESLGVKDDKDS